MKRKILLGLLIIFHLSCSTGKIIVSDDLIGNFYGVSSGYTPSTSVEYVLNLNSDNTFNFKIYGHDYSPECIGKWEQKNDTLLLKCEEAKDIGKMLSSGYMNQREFIILVMNKNKLKFNNLVLKRSNTPKL